MQLIDPPLAPSRHEDTFTRTHLPPPEHWPEFFFEVDVQYPEQINAAYELVDRHVREGRGHRIAFHGINKEGSFKWSYDQLLRHVDQIASVLVHDMGLRSGNRLLLRGANSPMMAACWLAGVKAGLVLVPTMPLLRSVELKPIIEKAQVCAALCAESLYEDLSHCLDPLHPNHTPTLKQVLRFDQEGHSEIWQQMRQYTEPFEPAVTSRDDVCLIAFTSGTTGKPKGTMHFHRDVLAMSDLFPKHILKMTENDVVCGTPPIAFTFGLGGLLTFPLRYGASTILIEKHTPESLLQTISQFGATQCYTAPTFYRQMTTLASNYDLSNLRHPVSAGEALPDTVRQDWRAATGIEITDGIGGTEMIHIYIASAGVDVKPGYIGKVIPGYEACIVDDNLNPLPAGQVGRLAVRGPTGCRYLDDSRQQDYVKGRWNLPGDTFCMDEDGYFKYVARNDDMIVSAGYNIAGPEVEAALLQHPAVAECGVIGLPDNQRGQLVTAYVVPKSGHNPCELLAEQLQQFVKDNIAPYKYPRRIVFVNNLPRTETGKLQRFKLRELG